MKEYWFGVIVDVPDLRKPRLLWLKGHRGIVVEENEETYTILLPNPENEVLRFPGTAHEIVLPKNCIRNDTEYVSIPAHLFPYKKVLVTISIDAT